MRDTQVLTEGDRRNYHRDPPLLGSWDVNRHPILSQLAPNMLRGAIMARQNYPIATATAAAVTLVLVVI